MSDFLGRPRSQSTGNYSGEAAIRRASAGADRGRRPALLHQRGMEKESLRVTPAGFIAQTDHQAHSARR
jgi:hypothetical protein